MLVTLQVNKKINCYRNNVILPCVTLWCTSYYEHDDNLPIPDKLTTVCWCDGGQTHLNAITHKSNQTRDATNKKFTLKHYRGRTAVKQVCDACPVFRLFKEIAKMATK